MSVDPHGADTRGDGRVKKVELLYFDGCPGYEKAERALRSALLA